MKSNSYCYSDIILIPFITQFFCEVSSYSVFLYGDMDVHAHFHLL